MRGTKFSSLSLCFYEYTGAHVVNAYRKAEPPCKIAFDGRVNPEGEECI